MKVVETLSAQASGQINKCRCWKMKLSQWKQMFLALPWEWALVKRVEEQMRVAKKEEAQQCVSLMTLISVACCGEWFSDSCLSG